MKFKIIAIIFLIFFLAGCIQPEQPQQQIITVEEKPTIKEEKIKIELKSGNLLKLTDEYNPGKKNMKIRGKTVVWSDRIKEDGIKLNYDIYLRDLEEGKETKITLSDGDQQYPDTYGDYLVYQDYTFGNWQIILTNLKTGKTERIATKNNNQYPSIYKNIVVWHEKINKEFSVSVYNIDTKETKKITKPNNSKDSYPEIYEDIITWQRTSEDGTDVCYAKTSDLKVGCVESVENQKQRPRLFQNTIVWEDYRSGKPEIYSYNIDTKEEKLIVSEGYPFNASVYENKIVYESSKEGEINNIYLYDLKTNEEKRLKPSSRAQTNPSIYDNLVVWEEYKKANSGESLWAPFVYVLE